VPILGTAFCKNIGYIGNGKVDLLFGGNLKINTL
jgi:hypothetical protein